MHKKFKAAFFDRDGTLIKDAHYLSKLEDVEVIPDAITIAGLCMALGFKIFVVTNQSGIARGYFDEAFVRTTHAYLQELFRPHGISFQAFYYCPHGPADNCICRKPNPGMLQQAARDHNIDLAASLMFGDKQSDLDAGAAAGCSSFDITTLFGLTAQECAKLITGQFKPSQGVYHGIRERSDNTEGRI